MFLSPGGADARAIRARALTKARNNTDHAEGGLTGRGGAEISCLDQREGRSLLKYRHLVITAISWSHGCENSSKTRE